MELFIVAAAALFHGNIFLEAFTPSRRTPSTQHIRLSSYYSVRLDADVKRSRFGPRDTLLYMSAGAGPRGEEKRATGGGGGLEGAGPRGERSRRRTTTSSRRRRGTTASRTSSSSSSGRRRSVATPVSTKRAPHQFDHKKADARPFIDAATEIAIQRPNEDARAYELDSERSSNDLRCMWTSKTSSSSETSSVAEEKTYGKVVEKHFEFVSLDDLFPDMGFSNLFCKSKEFRDSLRNAMREDIFDTTPAYSGMSDKARRMLLLPDSSLQGSWRCRGSEGGGVTSTTEKVAEDDSDGSDTTDGNDHDKKEKLRMKGLTQVLKHHLGPNAPTGDAFMETIGSLCGSSPSTHWIDIVGITDRKISHSWHQDTGRSVGGDTRTVLLGFPPKDEYDSLGVFTHLIKLEREVWAPEEHPDNEPLVYSGTVDEEFIVRPRFDVGREILVYRDVDVLHSAPDVACRASVMRFM